MPIHIHEIEKLGFQKLAETTIGDVLEKLEHFNLTDHFKTFLAEKQGEANYEIWDEGSPYESYEDQDYHKAFRRGISKAQNRDKQSPEQGKSYPEDETQPENSLDQWERTQ